MRMLGASLPVLDPAVAGGRRMAGEAGRTGAAPWRAWYKTARWQALRWEVLVAALFTCARCKRVEGATSQLVADHVVAHRGDAGLFWDRGNLQCLCKGCHDGLKQAEERRGW